MSKYTSTELREMARTVIADYQDGGEKGFEVVLRVCMATGLEPEDVQQRIERLANAEQRHTVERSYA